MASQATCVRIAEYPDATLCEVASKAAVARAAALNEITDEAKAVLSILTEESPDIAYASARVNSILAAAERDPIPEAVPYDQLLVSVVRSLENVVSAEPSALLEQAIAAVQGLSGYGWIVIRQEGTQ